MQHDFTTLTGITAAATKLNNSAKSWGLDFDMEIRPEDGAAIITFWDKSDSNYEISWKDKSGLEPEDLSTLLEKAEDWFNGHCVSVKNGLEQAVCALQADCENLRRALTAQAKNDESHE